MGTGSSWTHLVAGRILGLEDMADTWLTPTREDGRQLRADVWGGGGIFTTLATLTVSSGRFTLAADRTAMTPDGYRLVLDNAADGFTNVPFANSGATAYTVGARRYDVPAGTCLTKQGRVEWSAYTEAIGRPVTPASVTDTGAGLRLTMTSTLWTAEKHGNAAYTRPVKCWFQDANGRPAVNGSEAIYDGSLVYDGSAYYVDVPHSFGQDSAAPSTTAARYTVLLEGLTVASGADAAGASFVDYHVVIGTITSGAFSSAAATVIDSLGELWSDYQAEHDPADGSHTDVSADSVTATGTIHTDGNLEGDRVALNAALGKYMRGSPLYQGVTFDTNTGGAKGYPTIMPSTGSLKIDRDATNALAQGYRFKLTIPQCGYSGLVDGKVSVTPKVWLGISGAGARTANVTVNLYVVDGYGGTELAKYQVANSATGTSGTLAENTMTLIAGSATFPTSNTGEPLICVEYIVNFDAGATDSVYIGDVYLALSHEELE